MRDLSVVGVVALLVLASVGPVMNRALADSPPQPTAESADVPAEIPDEARDRENPVPAITESIDYGRLIFSSQCTMCHGASGDGKGRLAMKYEFDLPDFTQKATQARRTDGELFYILTHGHGKMTGEGDRLKEKVKWDIVNYIRSLATE